MTARRWTECSGKWRRARRSIAISGVSIGRLAITLGSIALRATVDEVVGGDKRMPEQEPADLSALSDLCTPWCIHVVATLRIADHIAAGTTDIKILAEKAECNADFLQRVL